MADDLTKEQRHKNMKNIHGKDTKIEVILRKALWNKGYRYRKNYKILPGIRFWGEDIKQHTDECVRVVEETIFDNIEFEE